MQWTKIPTNLLINRLSDQEIVSIVKYQLLWADLEYQPDDKTALRYLTNKQLIIVKQWLNAIETQVVCDIHSSEANRKRVKLNYLKNKEKTENLSISLTNSLSNSLCKQIRQDKIIEDNIKEIYKEKFEEFWNLYTPIKCDGRFVAKGDKKSSLAKFIKILEKGEDYENIIRGTKQYINYCRQNNQLTCGVPVFLNQERWKNDYSGSTCQSSERGKRQEPRSFVETYAQIAAEYEKKNNI